MFGFSPNLTVEQTVERLYDVFHKYRRQRIREGDSVEQDKRIKNIRVPDLSPDDLRYVIDDACGSPETLKPYVARAFELSQVSVIIMTMEMSEFATWPSDERMAVADHLIALAAKGEYVHDDLAGLHAVSDRLRTLPELPVGDVGEAFRELERLCRERKEAFELKRKNHELRHLAGQELKSLDTAIGRQERELVRVVLDALFPESPADEPPAAKPSYDKQSS